MVPMSPDWRGPVALGPIRARVGRGEIAKAASVGPHGRRALGCRMVFAVPLHVADPVIGHRAPWRVAVGHGIADRCAKTKYGRQNAGRECDPDHGLHPGWAT